LKLLFAGSPARGAKKINNLDGFSEDALEAFFDRGHIGGHKMIFPRKTHRRDRRLSLIDTRSGIRE
jgi:hypothetical protein